MTSSLHHYSTPVDCTTRHGSLTPALLHLSQAERSSKMSPSSKNQSKSITTDQRHCSGWTSVSGCGLVIKGVVLYNDYYFNILLLIVGCVFKCRNTDDIMWCAIIL